MRGLIDDEGIRKPDSVADTESASDPVSSVALHEMIFQRLKRALLVGEMRPGEAVTMRSLATKFGTSAMPVRDAIGRLVAAQALELGSNRTVLVPKMSRARYLEILRVRIALETMVTAMAVPQVDDATLARLQSLNEKMISYGSDDPRSYFECNQHFHFQLYHSAKSLVTMSIIESLWMHSGPFLGLIFNTPGVEFGRDNHEAILRAVRRGSPEAAAEAVAKDLTDAADIILSLHDFSRTEI
jgi:DNA-binding GntR family transcriptional regulator